MLEKLKAVAYRGKLNCGHCAVSHKLEDGTVKINRCAEGAYCGRWFLHKFRHTYATRHLQDGIDIRTLQQWMGHRDIASTMVYLTRRYSCAAFPRTYGCDGTGFAVRHRL
jgi:integrase